MPTAGYFILVVITWGSSFVLMKVALVGISPGQVAVSRGVFGAAALILMMLVTRTPWPRSWRLWGHIAIVSVVQCVIPWLLIPWAEQYAPSSSASISNATVPIWAMVFAPFVIRGERLRPVQRIGLVLGLIGVLILIGPWEILGSFSSGVPLPVELALIGGAVACGFSLVYLRRTLRDTPSDALAIATMQTGIAAVIFLVISPLFALQPVRLDWPVVLCALALGVFSTGFGFVWNTRVLQAWGAPLAAAANYAMPIVGVTLGILFLGERLQWYEPVGGVVILVGIFIGQGRWWALRRTPGEPRARSPQAPATSPLAPPQRRTRR